jgi:hypothetical protein
MAAMTFAPRRRWFRYSLRTLFVVMTVVCCWLGWNVHIVRQRQAAWAEVIAERDARDKIWMEKLAAYSDQIGLLYTTIQQGPAKPVTLPLTRRLLGDVAHHSFERNREADARRSAMYFPEAKIVCYLGTTSRVKWIRAELDRMYLRESQPKPSRTATHKPVFSEP